MADYITKTAKGDLLLAVLYFTTCGLGACLLACDYTLTQAERIGTAWGCLCFMEQTPNQNAKHQTERQAERIAEHQNGRTAELNPARRFGQMFFPGPFSPPA